MRNKNAISLPELPKKSKSSTELLQELINEVLLRLPARSIGRFRCVSKSWLSHLSSPKFVKSHRNFHLRRGTPSAIHFNGKDLLTFPADGTNGRSGKVKCQLNLPSMNWMRVVATCHGFVLLIREPLLYELYVINPVTWDYLRLPDYKTNPELKLEYVVYGMGYDSGTDDYKVVQLLHYEPVESEGLLVDVYSLKMKSWKRVVNPPYNFINDDDGVYLNGFLHWVALDKNDEKYVMSAFDLSRDEFDEVLLPKGFGGEIMQVAVLRECLALMCKINANTIVVWLMNEYGVQESWEKLVTYHGGVAWFGYSLSVFFLSREDELFFTKPIDNFAFGMAAYNLKSGVWRDIVIEDCPNFFGSSPLTFTDSLLSPDHIADQTEE